MNKAKAVLNAFTAGEVCDVTGLSRPMIDYLARAGFLTPAYAPEGRPVRGRVRYYSYRDLVVARIVQRLRENGVELQRLKAAIRMLGADDAWIGAGANLGQLVTDGARVYVRGADGSLSEANESGQKAFSFVIDLTVIRDEVRNLIPLKKLAGFRMNNAPLEFEPSSKAVGTRR